MVEQNVLDKVRSVATAEIDPGDELWRSAETAGDIVMALTCLASRVQMPPGVVKESNDVRFAVARAWVETRVDAIEEDVDRLLDPLPDRIERPLERFLGVDSTSVPEKVA